MKEVKLEMWELDKYMVYGDPLNNLIIVSESYAFLLWFNYDGAYWRTQIRRGGKTYTGHSSGTVSSTNWEDLNTVEHRDMAMKLSIKWFNQQIKELKL
jgi:hypothetical protein